MERLALFGGKSVLDKPLPPYNSIGEEEISAVVKVMREGTLSGFLGRGGDRFLGGPTVRQLEADFCKKFGIKFAVSFNSATTALETAIAALGIGPGDEVITTPFTMPATATAILRNGATPIFADIDPDTFTIDPRSVILKLTARTRAILAVNLFGGPVNYEGLKQKLRLTERQDIVIIEDNAQAPGATYSGKYTGTIGTIGVFSFNVHKTIQCGEGGMLVTDDQKIAYRAQLIRNHGEAVMDDIWEDTDVREFVAGSNLRLTEIQAAIMIEQLKKLDHLNDSRIELARHLEMELNRENFPWLLPASWMPGGSHVFYLYPFRFQSALAGISRETFARALAAEGFPVQVGYQKPLYLLPIFKHPKTFSISQQVTFELPAPKLKLYYEKGQCPVAENAYEKEIFLTRICQPPATKEHIELFVTALRKIKENLPILRDHENR